MSFLLLLLFCLDVADMTGFTVVVPDEKDHKKRERTSSWADFT